MRSWNRTGLVPGVFNAALERSGRLRIEPVVQSSCGNCAAGRVNGEDHMAGLSGLSDEALAVFAFAAYHQLSSGQTVRSVVQRDGSGHKASDTAVGELQAQGLIEADGDEIRFTPEGEEALQGLISSIRGG